MSGDSKYSIKYDDIRINVIRIVSTIMILVCHVTDYYGIGCEFWSVAVFTFLYMSGFLYGSREKLEKHFILKNIWKVLRPVWACEIVVILVNCISEQEIKALFIIQNILFRDFYDGLGHLWFMSLIIFCYVITPMLSLSFKNLLEGEYFESHLYRLSIGGVLAVYLFVGYYTNLMDPGFIASYVIGFAVGKYSIRSELKTFPYAMILLGAILTAFRYIFGISYSFENGLFRSYYFFSRIFLGIAVFYLIWIIVSKVDEIVGADKFSMRRTINVIGRSSFFIFIVHNVFIYGKLSLLDKTQYMFINILCFGSAVVIGGFLLGWADKLCRRLTLQNIGSTRMGEK